LALASEVAFCALCLPAPPATAPEAPAVSVFSQLLSLGYLWEEIRAKGGAYGGFCAYDGSGQLFQMLSYRDPNIPRTLSIMQAVGGQLAKMDLSPAEIERAVISCAKIEERPIRPGPATATALWRQILRYSDEVRRERYQALLGVDAAAVRTAAAALLDQGTAAGAVCVLAGRPLLEAANAKLSAALTIEDVLEGADEGDAEATVAE
jgi:Zn-dependent M16 (insulinase) family peptidase